MRTVYDPVSGQYRFNYTVFIEIAAGSVSSAVLLFLFWSGGATAAKIRCIVCGMGVVLHDGAGICSFL